MGATLGRVTRNETYAGHTTLEAEVCGACGVLFAAPKIMLDACRQDGDSFFCPNGHSLSYTESENDKLKRQLQNAKDGRAAERAKRDQAEASLRTTKGVVTKMRKRIAAGVCPCCRRSFQDLARHMESQHPDFAS